MEKKRRFTPHELTAWLLGQKMFTRKELSDRLKKEGFSEREIHAAFHDFERDGYIDDRMFIVRYVEDRRRFRPRGYHALYGELLRRGISRSRLERFREKYYPLDREVEDAYRLFTGWAQSLPEEMSEKVRYRLTGRLLRRGFSAEAIELAWSRYHACGPSDYS
ncbi:MAG TPA: RecX family transcriptional regulator [Atribacteraceae bacterium]|nr:RecX family transcriptional regulator [Atribacteraceae bacterium]